MKKKASSVVKQIISFLSSIGDKAKVVGVKTKADAMRARLLLISLLKSESRPSLITSISHKFHALIDRKPHDEDFEETGSQAMVVHDGSVSLNDGGSFRYGDGDVEEEFPDLNSLFDVGDGDDELDQGDGSVIDMVKHSKENQGQDFVLENEIDNVADLFIRRFKKQIRLQKLESFKRFQQMLDRSV